MRLIKKFAVSLLCVMILTLGFQAPLIARAASEGAAPQNKENLEGYGEGQQAIMNTSVTVPCQGYIVPVSATPPKTDDNGDGEARNTRTHPVYSAAVPKTSSVPKTGDSSEIRLYAIAALFALLILLGLMSRRERQKEVPI